METIKLQEIVGYLPWGLNGISTEDNYGLEKVKGFNFYGVQNQVNIVTDVDDIDLEMFKPILHSISSLTEFREDLGFVPIEDLFKLDFNISVNDIKIIGDCIVFRGMFQDKVLSTLNTDRMLFSYVKKLYKWHIDIHNLIPRNLAIDIKTLKQ
jgi:hypothetical protein